MTVAEVKKLFPKAYVPDAPISFPDATELLRLAGFEVAHARFTVHFYFTSEKLIQVTLEADKREPFHMMEGLFRDVVVLLRAKYGTELSSESKRSVVQMSTTEWLSGKTNIGVIVIGVVGSDANLNINYQVRLAKEASKL